MFTTPSSVVSEKRKAPEVKDVPVTKKAKKPDIKAELGNDCEEDIKLEEVWIKEEYMEDTQEALKMEDKKTKKKRTLSQSCFRKSKKNQSEIVGVQDEPDFEKNALLLDDIKAELGNDCEEDIKIEEEEYMEDTQEALKMEDKKTKKERTHAQSCFRKSKKNQSEIVGVQEEPNFEKNALLQDILSPVCNLTYNEDEEGPRKRSKIADQLTPEQEQDLVKWYSAHPIFYDQTVRDFKNKGKRDRLMEGKAKEMGLTSVMIWIWFKSMRTVYGKLKKRKSGLAAKPLTSRQQWTIASFSFLEAHMSVRGECRQLGKVSDTAETGEEEAHEEGNESEVSIASSSQAADQSATSQQPMGVKGKATAKPTVRRVDEAIVQLADRISTSIALQEDLQSTMRASNNDRMAFCHWLGLETRKLNEQLWCSFMTDAFALVMRYRQLQHHQQAHPAPQPNPPPHPQTQLHQSVMQPPMMATGATSLPSSTPTYLQPQQQQHQPWVQASVMSPQPDLKGLNTSGFSDVLASMLPGGPSTPSPETRTTEMLTSASQVLNTPEYPTTTHH